MKISIIDINTAAKALIDGEVIIIPTETVYGIAADARNNKAIKKIYEIKGRSHTKPLQVMVSDIAKAKKFLKFDEFSEKIATKFLPGPLTMILNKTENSGLVKEINLNNDTIGLRIPDHKILLELLKLIDFPIAATSANISGKKDPTTAKEAINNLKNKEINYCLDGGTCKISLPSTVADFTKSEVLIIREGSITLEQIKKP